MLKNYVFDLYGTLVDIRTNEWKPYLWKKMAEFYGLYGAHYTAKELAKTYDEFVKEETEATYEAMKGKKGIKCLDDVDIQLEKVFLRLFTEKGVEADIALATSFNNTVLPVLGCATINPRCPFPMGAKRSIMRVQMLAFGCPVKLIFSSGNIGVK